MKLEPITYVMHFPTNDGLKSDCIEDEVIKLQM
jgi:hypothetical protein